MSLTKYLSVGVVLLGVLRVSCAFGMTISISPPDGGPAGPDSPGFGIHAYEVADEDFQTCCRDYSLPTDYAFPFAHSDTVSNGINSVTTGYDLSSDGFFLNFEHTRGGGDTNGAISAGLVEFTVDEIAEYQLQGTYAVTDLGPSGRLVYYYINIFDITDDVYLSRNGQTSEGTVNSGWEIGTAGGESYLSEGALVGTLQPGHEYRFFWEVQLENTPSGNAFGASAVGSVGLAFTPVPEPSTVTLFSFGLIGISVCRVRSRRHRGARQSAS